MAERVLIVAHSGALGMELPGVRDILKMANWSLVTEGQARRYEIEVATLDGKPVELWGGSELGPARELADVSVAVDTLIVVGGPVADDASEAPELVRGVARVGREAGRVVGICTGAFLLGAAGLLDGRRCTTHWAWSDGLAERFPLAKVEADATFIADGKVWTSAGVSAGFDMLLAMVKNDLGVRVSRRVAQRLVLYMRRTGGQAQFRDGDSEPVASQQPIREIQHYISAHPAADLSLQALADRVAMSPRHFARVFRTELGVSPGRYVERVRVSVARGLLEDAVDSVTSISAVAGFGTYRAMHRSFTLNTGVSPAEYRRRFGAAS